jgi:hypothetical protein
VIEFEQKVQRLIEENNVIAKRAVLILIVGLLAVWVLIKYGPSSTALSSKSQ